MFTVRDAKLVFKENTRARRFYEKHGFYFDGNEHISEFHQALEVKYIKI